MLNRAHAPNPTPTPMKINPLSLALIAPLILGLASCREKGPAARAGENFDKAVENVKDAVDPKGPVEKAGEKIDKALKP